ncbi:UNVERIFIED_CONTAM: hypothetical protein K2H54_060741 [Gekko kuhli]
MAMMGEEGEDPGTDTQTNALVHKPLVLLEANLRRISRLFHNGPERLQVAGLLTEEIDIELVWQEFRYEMDKLRFVGKSNIVPVA